MNCCFCNLPLEYQHNTRCANGCVDKSYEWKEIRSLRNELRINRDKELLDAFKSGMSEAASLAKDSATYWKQQGDLGTGYSFLKLEQTILTTRDKKEIV